MDPLTHILRSTRFRSPLIADLRLGIDVSLGFAHQPGIPFHYVVEGSCRLACQRQSVRLEAGDFVLLPRWPDYRVETGRGSQHIEIMDFAEQEGLAADYLKTGVDRALLTTVGGATAMVRLLSGIVTLAGQEHGPLMRNLPEITLVQNANAQNEAWLAAAIDLVSSEGSTPAPGFAAVAERIIELIFVMTLRRSLLGSAHEKGWVRGLADPTISRALDAIHAEPARHWTLRDIAAASGRSRSGFAEHFRATMEETPFAYLARLRMHLASGMVEEGRRSIADVGASLGYRSSHAFARAFTETFGETPTQFRRHGRDRP
ncbi:AraC family transcriptional regulator [Lichenicoccus sp.]|uniref:AraC family transcriptional regulator n=1 Tax=Lichenicoccus sp. TaxID=2781899 RepID=UPI003D0BCA93